MSSKSFRHFIETIFYNMEDKYAENDENNEMGNSVDTDKYILTRDFSDELGNKYWAKFSPKPFEAGVSRFAFKGTIRGSGPKKEKACVVKVFKEEYAVKFDDWVPDLYTSIKARELATIFTNDVLPLLDLPRKVTIEFIVPMFAEVDETTMVSEKRNERKNNTIDKKEVLAIEEFIDGEYVKFNSNAGYEDLELSDLMPTFMHWSWQYSGNKMMVCDLQGVKSPDAKGDHYVLTDPAVHSLEEIFGLTDLGVAGMYRVLCNHTCTKYCRQLGLSNPIKGLINLIRGQPKETTYKFDLSESERRMNSMEKRR